MWHASFQFHSSILHSLFYAAYYIEFTKPSYRKRSLPKLEFGPVVGDFDIEINQYNMRQCATAAFMRYNLRDRQMVRPITVNSTDLPVERIQNEIVEGEFFSANEFMGYYLMPQSL